jgi:hypothetical protein
MNKNKGKTEDLAKEQNRSDIKQNGSDYINNMIPEIYIWRNYHFNH